MRANWIVLLVALMAGCSGNPTAGDGGTDVRPTTDAADATVDGNGMDAASDVAADTVSSDTPTNDVPAADAPVDQVAADAPRDAASDTSVIDVTLDVGFDARPDTGATDTGSGDVVQSDGNTDSGGGPCSSTGCGVGLTCCTGTCMNLQNDPLNCGSCGHLCPNSAPMCLAGTCTTPTCSPACTSGFTCCAVNGPGPTRPPSCYPGRTCPVGCPACL